MNNQDILFLDIETVPERASYDLLPERTKALWNKKAKFLIKSEGDSYQSTYERAGIYAEFGKVVSIAFGSFSRSEGLSTIRVQDLSGHDEFQLLTSFSEYLESRPQKSLRLCAHNGKEFDFPYLARRMIINNIPIPQCLRLSGKKPWEIHHIDTMEMWKFGDYKNFTSLDLLANVLDIPTSKSDIDGSEVCRVYYKENDLPRIAKYCKRDVAVLVQVYLKLSGQPALSPKNIVFVQ